MTYEHPVNHTKDTPRTVRYEALESPCNNRYEACQIRHTSVTAGCIEAFQIS